MTPCRCGHIDVDGMPHPCHAMGYTCRKPAKMRLYNVKPVALAGVQLKFGASETWACDDCWADWQKLRAG